MRRILDTVATLAVATLAVTALAAPASATVCPILTDPAGDGRWPMVAGGVSSPQLDIVSADVATGATTLVAVLRVADLNGDNLGLLGVTWRLGWYLDGVNQHVEVRRGANGRVTATFVTGGTAVPVGVAFDYGTGAITWAVARSAVPGLAAGATFATFGANSNVFGSTADAASEFTNTYVDGDPGCVPAA